MRYLEVLVLVPLVEDGTVAAVPVVKLVDEGRKGVVQHAEQDRCGIKTVTHSQSTHTTKGSAGREPTQQTQADEQSQIRRHIGRYTGLCI